MESKRIEKALRLFVFIAMIIWIIVLTIEVKKLNKTEDNSDWIVKKTEIDEFGYGETNVGSSGLYVYTTRPLLDSAGCTENSNVSRMTDWELTIVVDSVQQTEYLIFKDTTTGNIAAVERRKYEEVTPEEEKIYLDN